MNKKISRLFFSLVATVMLFSLLCFGENTTTETQNPYAITAQAAAKKTIKLKKTKATVTTGATYTLKLLDKKGKAISATKVKWSTSSKKTATVSSKGVVKGIKKGTATITAKYKGKKYTCKITVKNPALSAKNKTLTTGSSFTLTLKDGAGKAISASKVKWSSKDKSIATVSKKGTVKAVKKGSVKITATYKGKKYTCTVTVKNASLSAKKKTLAPGKTYTLTLKDGADKKISATKVKWSTSNKSVATVSKKGVIKAVKSGSATITATYKSKKYTCKVTVEKAAPSSTLLYQDSNVKISYHSIEKSTYDEDRAIVYFKVQNKTSNEITIQADAVSLNGHCFNYTIASSDIAPKSTGLARVTLCNFDFSKVNINNIDYVGGQLRIISDDFRTYDAIFENKNLYGKPALTKAPSVSSKKKKIFSDGNINMYFDYAKADSYFDDELKVYLLVENKTDRSILIQNNSVSISGISYDYTIMSDTVLPYSTGHVDITVKDFYGSSSAVKTIGGVFRIIDNKDIGDTYEAIMGTFTDVDPWAEDYGLTTPEYEENENEQENGEEKPDNAWTYDDFLKFDKYYSDAKRYSDKMYEYYQKSTSVANIDMKKTHLTFAKSYADLGQKSMASLVELCKGKASLELNYNNGKNSTFLELAEETYNEFHAIATLEITAENARECESAIGQHYVTIMGKYVVIGQIHSAFKAQF